MTAQPSQARAPGKVILLGEHAVVYGQPALALPLDRGVTVRCTPAARFSLVTLPLSGKLALEEALGRVAAELGHPRVEVSIESDIPLGAGLGSSAAVAVASTRALAISAGLSLSEEDLLQLAQGMEQTFHGRPSGIDHTTCATEALIRFERGQPDRVERIRCGRLQWVVAISGPRLGNTREKVLALRASWERDPSRLDPLFARIGALTQHGIDALTRGDLPALGALMNENHALLRDPLDLSTPPIEAIVARMQAHGAWGAKLTGAGGGGAVIALHPDPVGLVAQLEAEGTPAFVATWEGST